MLVHDPRFEVLDSLDGTEFERVLVELFELLGYEEVTRIGGYDKGADIIFVDDGKRVAVQAKRYSRAVGIGAVRQLLDGRGRYHCDRGLVVTNSFFTEPAIECAEANGIELWDRERLADFLNGDAPKIDTTVCAACGTPVTPGVTQWCLDHPARFDGNVLCRKHQSRRGRDALVAGETTASPAAR